MASSGNFASINFQGQSLESTVTQNETNLTFNGSSLSPGNYEGGVVCDFGMKGGKWYWETYLHGGGTGGNGRDWNVGFGAYSTCSKGGDESGIGQRLGKGPKGYGWTHYGLSDISIYHNGSGTAFGSDHANGDIVGHALDLENGTWTLYVNGSQVTGGAAVTGIDTTETWFAAGGANGGTVSSHDVTFNFGQDSTFKGAVSAGGNSDENGFGDFKYSVPSGYLACCSGNLEISADIDPAKTDSNFGDKQHGSVTYTGNATTGQAITGMGFQPDLIIAKMRSSSQSNFVSDTSRGINKFTFTDQSVAEQSSGGYTTVYSSFDSDGFTLGTSGSGPNDNGATYCAWGWRCNGGTTSSNSDGSITSTVQVNQEAGFSIVQYTGVNSATTATVGHGLGRAPTFIIHKVLNASGWHFFRGIPGMTSATTVRDMNPNGSPTDVSGSGGALVAPTSTVFNINNYTGIGGGGFNYVAYCWAPIEGYSSFGNFTGNGNADGPYIYTGFRPKTVLTIGEAYGNENFIFDTTRNPNNPTDNYLRWGRNSGETADSTSALISVFSNGFKIKGSNADINGSGGNKLYAAWGDVPWKYNNTF